MACCPKTGYISVFRQAHLQTYVYYQAFGSGSSGNFGYTTAVGLFRSMVGLLLMLVCNAASKKVRGRGIM